MSKRNNFPSPKNVIRRHDYSFRFAHARWAEQQKAAAWPGRFGESQFTAADSGDDARNRVGLAADLAWQQHVEFLEFGKLV